MKIGVLALQGDVREHARVLADKGAAPVFVSRPEDLSSIDGIVLPGGESTTIGKLLDRFGLLGPLQERIRAGMPAFGTCAGLILMAAGTVGRDPAPHRLAVMDLDVERNAYGRQAESFETDLSVDGLAYPFRAVFIRAPAIARTGPSVDVLASHDGAPVLVREGHLMGATFHPEMTSDGRVHDMFIALVGSMG